MVGSYAVGGGSRALGARGIGENAMVGVLVEVGQATFWCGVMTQKRDPAYVIFLLAATLRSNLKRFEIQHFRKSLLPKVVMQFLSAVLPMESPCDTTI